MPFSLVRTLYFPVTISVVLWGTSKGNKPPMTCAASRYTLEYIDRCPKDLSEWTKAAAEKLCTVIQQNCSSSDQFVYHCLINPWENAAVEVCALRTLIIGKCAEYNFAGAVVQEHMRLDCTEFDDPCPESYLSDKAYLYQECYNVVKNTKKATSSVATDRMHKIGAEKKTVLLFTHVVIAVLFYT